MRHILFQAVVATAVAHAVACVEGEGQPPLGAGTDAGPDVTTVHPLDDAGPDATIVHPLDDAGADARDASADAASHPDADASADAPTEAAADGPGSGLDASDASADSGPPLLDLPFAYTIDGGNVTLHTDGGDLYVSLGSWGAHFNPNSGHAYGDAKSNIAAYFTPDLTQATNVDGGVCHVGDSCQLAEATLAAKRPMYTAPIAGVVTEVRQERAPTSYYPANVQLSVRLRMAPYDLLLGHMGSVASGLRDKVLQATCKQGTCVDVDTWKEGGTGVATGLSIAVAAGEAIGRPQVVAAPAPTPGYFQGAGIIWVPWVEIEFFLSISGETLCYFDALDPTLKSALQVALDRDMADPQSVRFGPPFYQARKWQWGAEGRLCGAHSVFPMDFSSLYTNLGGWYQRPLDGGGIAEEVVAFAPIAKDAASYDAGLYSTPSVNALILRKRPNGSTTQYTFAMPDAAPLEVSDVEGEILEESGSALLVHWRDIRGKSGNIDRYQRAAYRLDPTGLIMRWGQDAPSAVQAPVPTLGVSDTCASSGVDCYDHQPRGSF